MRWVFVALAVLCGRPSWAQDCDVRAPKADLPTAADREALKGCEAQALYFGIGRDRDLVAARKCAFMEMEAGTKSRPMGYEGAAILMMIYANGEGVKRRPKLARDLFCKFEPVAQAEGEGMAAELDRMAEGGKWQRFDICNHATSGLFGMVCSANASRIAEAGRERRFGALTRGWSDPARAAFDALAKASTAYFEAHAFNENDRSGSAAQALAMDEASEMAAAFEKSLSLAKPPCKRPLAQADAALNAAYREYMALPEPTGLGSVRPADVKMTEHLWLAYRDAWTAFGKERWPDVDPSCVTAWQTDLRTSMLRELIRYTR